jgi:hypothetical protein
VNWEEYQQELKAVENGDLVLNYRAAYIPKEMRQGDKLWLTHNGKVRGWMTITGLAVQQKSWTCRTTGKLWAPGKYIQRSGLFHHVENGPRIKGFRGIRKFSPEKEGEA